MHCSAGEGGVDADSDMLEEVFDVINKNGTLRGTFMVKYLQYTKCRVRSTSLFYNKFDFDLGEIECGARRMGMNIYLWL